MKKLGIIFIIFALTFVSCAEEDSISKQEKRAEKERKEQVEAEVETVGVDDYSYWFVVVQRKNDGTLFNKTIKQEHRYFSAEEMKAEFDDDVFLLNLVEISRETFEQNE